MEADAARDRFRKIRAPVRPAAGQLDLTGALTVKQNGREVEILADGNSEQLLEKLRAFQPEDWLRIAVAGGNFRGVGCFEKSHHHERALSKKKSACCCRVFLLAC